MTRTVGGVSDGTPSSSITLPTTRWSMLPAHADPLLDAVEGQFDRPDLEGRGLEGSPTGLAIRSLTWTRPRRRSGR